MPNFCSQCGASIDTGARFCGSCGKPTQQAASPPVQPPPSQYAPPPQYAAPPPPPQYAQPPQYVPPVPQYNAPPVSQSSSMPVTSSKSKVTAALLAFFLGQLGIHRFYLGRVGTGVLQIILAIVGYATIVVGVGVFVLWALGIWILIDFIMILVGKFKDKNGLPLK